ncbi:undecaprenyldiphospho-muramoylpentapeptide beta-N-acetylglucosaminyltransferase [Beijerinckia indica]|uniref:UDP-N-acetylglucosamine--N-acetylmuramyl-(pentapeptide) pyrophosphoryl-undecaprenol N-acetylglucosamine transferase n=1 Tax=Beijerinckia indica subsp. indica (strain ATCC 9039 / DSM 1715 / NCIMB 8712) TaxID=395963 RepID=B2IGG0_BEII9|nr:undecaprenyldiphospho-muramoylpentapeptide beta-N-acetylglucosaminyltransferase [Beijerinckia indica]ACB94342.1 UDP-N-acetylglucosamine--N-acetylmuramyl-(pentapeptide) pyrophosphoryl-undecaprenol N-acetylglucosamine transferase [Beijerinckia indica subsp. indica ATCC 9039]
MSDLHPILVAAGGTGGHLFPAEALSRVLIKRGFPVELITDERATKYGSEFPARATHVVASATPSQGSPLHRLLALGALARGTWEAVRLLKRIRPSVLVGFGGYPTVPPVLAASWLGVPSILHEQNAVMGRANRFLAGRVNAVAKGFEGLGGIDPGIAAKTVLTGNPVRPAVLAAAQQPYLEDVDGRLRLLVTGGSQGARIMSDVVPKAIELVPEAIRARFIIVQQARPEDEARVRAIYANLGVEATIQSFFTDLPSRIAEANLVIGRAGASTVSELAVIGRPSILVPFPHALDQDQAANAAHLSATGAALVVPQTEFTPDWLASRLVEIDADRPALAKKAYAARKAGLPDAAERLADLVIRFASGEKTIHAGDNR